MRRNYYNCNSTVSVDIDVDKYELDISSNNTITVDIEIDDFIDQIGTTNLLTELKSRSFKILDKFDIIENSDSFNSDKDKQEILYAIFDLKKWQGKERLLEEINNIF